MKLSQLAAHSRVWVYQADRELSADEIALLNEKGQQFIATWSAHGAELEAAFEIRHGLFVIIAIDEQVAQATGCSIDKSVHLMKDLGNQLGIDFFNRLNIAYQQGEEILMKPMSQFQDDLKSGDVNEDTVVFNNLIQHLGEFNTSWQTSVKNSWHKQLL